MLVNLHNQSHYYFKEKPYLCTQGNKTCVRWAFGRAQIPASDALTHEVILTCILGVNIGAVTSLVAALFS